MKPLIKPCGLTSNWLTFQIIGTVMSTFVKIILCSENQPPFGILPHCLLPSPCPTTLLSTQLGSMWSQHRDATLFSILNTRALNSSRPRGCLHSIHVQVLLPSLCLNLWLSSFPKPQPLETWNSTSLLPLTLFFFFFFHWLFSKPISSLISRPDCWDHFTYW